MQPGLLRAVFYNYIGIGMDLVRIDIMKTAGRSFILFEMGNWYDMNNNFLHLLNTQGIIGGSI